MARKPGFGASIASEVVEAFGNGEAPALPAGDVLVSRGKALTKLGADVQYEQYEWIDPALCKPSGQNARRYDDLTYDDCAELIQSIRSEGRQRMPAIVRRTNDPDVPYEIVAGSRRHFAISWLRANNYPDFKYLVDVQPLDDEAAFRLSDLENRARADVSDIERAKSYQMALHSHYKGDTAAMADRLGVARATIYRYMSLADLDEVFVLAFGDPKSVTISHPRAISSIVKEGGQVAERVRTEALRLGVVQAERASEQAPPMSPAEVIAALRNAAKPPRPSVTANTSFTIGAADGGEILTYTKVTKKKGMTIVLPPKITAGRAEVEAAFQHLIDELFEKTSD